MKKIIVGNWKNNPSTEKEAQELFNKVKLSLSTRPGLVDNVEVVICPSFAYLSNFEFRTSDFIKLGVQNITNEFSVPVLKKMGVEYVILGHSDVRKFGETNEVINKKIQEALAAGLKVILCVGENAGEDKTSVLEKQIKEGLDGVSNVIVAYEPVWAISKGDGQGNNCLPKDVVEAASLIKRIAGDVKILYGGSVNAENAKQYLEIMDGLLVGGASLDAGEFIRIVKSA